MARLMVLGFAALLAGCATTPVPQPIRLTAPAASPLVARCVADALDGRGYRLTVGEWFVNAYQKFGSAPLTQLRARRNEQTLEVTVDYPAGDAAMDAQRIVDACSKTREQWSAELRAKGWDSATVDAILSEELIIGMSEDMVLSAWGPPRSVNRTITASGAREQWVYLTAYAYIENGKLVAVQDSR